MAELLDARGLSCPLPVLRTKALLEKGKNAVDVLVDSAVARENVARFARSRGYEVEVGEAEPGCWVLRIRREVAS